MTWMEKLELTIQKWPMVRISLRFSDVGSPQNMVQELAKFYPFLPTSYLDLLLKFDGIELDCFRFNGLCSGRFRSMAKERAMWREYEFDVDTACPFAVDAGGRPLFIHSDGSIWLYEIDPPIVRKRVCDSFDELMGDGFFGLKYMNMVNVLDPIPEINNRWLKYLRESGWHQ
jgi:hypothetical protein